MSYISFANISHLFPEPMKTTSLLIAIFSSKYFGKVILPNLSGINSSVFANNILDKLRTSLSN